MDTVQPNRLGVGSLTFSFTSYMILGSSFKHCETLASHLQKEGASLKLLQSSSIYKYVFFGEMNEGNGQEKNIRSYYSSHIGGDVKWENARSPKVTPVDGLCC